MSVSHTGGVSSYLELTNLSKKFSANAVLDAFTLSVAKGEFITLLGPSGCGKTTLLRLIAGLLPADTGRISVNNIDITALPAHRRNIGMVFQSYALFPHLNVRDNVAFGLKARSIDRKIIDQEVRAAIDMVQLDEFSDRSVKTLSGGQQQRVSLARAVVTKPTLMLLDEPFSALDRKLRETMQIETRQILRRLGATAIFVTHDQEEALVLSDRIVVMNRGRVEQVGHPQEIYSNPKTLFVLNFVGKALRLKGEITQARNGFSVLQTRNGAIRLANSSFSVGQQVIAAVRPEKVTVGGAAGQDANIIQAKVREFIYLGSKAQVIFDADNGDHLMAELSAPPPPSVKEGSQVTISWPVSTTLGYSARD